MISLISLITLLQESVLLRSDKIYSVLAVILVIFVGILIYLFTTQRKLSKLEQMFKDSEKE
jgi:CcmD family protein